MTFKDLAFVIVQVLLLLVFIAIPGGFAGPFFVQLTAFILVLGGTFLTITAMLNLGKGLTPLPRPGEKSKLITTASYRFVRHPIYTGMLLILAGISLYSLNFPRALVTVMMLIVLHYKSRYEESLLILRYPYYGDYKNRTGKFLPRLKRKKKRGNH